MRGRRRGEGSPPYGEVTSSAVGRADRGVRPYGGLQEVRWGGWTEASAPTEGLQKARLVVACRIRIHTHIHYMHPQKPRRVCRPQAAKIQIIFHRDMCVGKNTSQAASVEFLRLAQKLCAQQTAILLSEKSKGFFDSF